MANKLNLPLIMDKFFRRTMFLQPMPDKTFKIVDITGMEGQYYKDESGATMIDPACLVRVRGLKRIDYIAMKVNGSPILTNMFDGRLIESPNADQSVDCPECGKQLLIHVPPIKLAIPAEQTMTEKTFGNMLNYAEEAGRLQGSNAEKDKKMNLILMAIAAVVLIVLFIAYKMNSGG